jgi:hypothetical protein
MLVIINFDLILLIRIILIWIFLINYIIIINIYISICFWTFVWLKSSRRWNLILNFMLIRLSKHQKLSLFLICIVNCHFLNFVIFLYLIQTYLRISLSFNKLIRILLKSRVLCFQLFLILNLITNRLTSRFRWIACCTSCCRTINMKIRWIIFIFLIFFLMTTLRNILVQNVLVLIFTITFLYVCITDHIYTLIIIFFTIHLAFLRILIHLHFRILFEIPRIICKLIIVLCLNSLIIKIILIILQLVNIIRVLLRIIMVAYNLTRLGLRFELLWHWTI